MAIAETTRTYLSTLARTYGLDEKALIAKAEADESAAKFVDESVMLRSDYSRKQDALTVAQREAAEAKSKAEGYYQNEWLPKWNEREQGYSKTQQELTTLKAKEAAYRAVYGDLEGFNPAAPAVAAPSMVTSPAAAQPQYMTREDAAALSGTLAKEMTWVAEMHRDEFGKRLDVDEFERHVMAGKYSGPKALRDAYADFTKTAREAKQATDQAAHDARIREEAVKEYAVTHHLPVDNGAPAPRGSQFFRQPSKDEATAATLADSSVPRFVKDQVLRDEFTQGLNGAQLSGALFKS